MLRTSHDLEIPGAVISPVAVDVVDIFVSAQWTAKNISHDLPVFFNSSSFS